MVDKTDMEKFANIRAEINEVIEEFIRLKKFEADMYAKQPFKVGDRVELTEKILGIDYDKAYGWANNRGMLRPGNSGTVREVTWNSYHKYWGVGIMFDVEWSISSMVSPAVVYIKPKPVHTYFLSYKYVRHIPEDVVKPILPPYDFAKYVITHGAEGKYKSEEISFDEVYERFGKQKATS